MLKMERVNQWEWAANNMAAAGLRMLTLHVQAGEGELEKGR